MGEMLDWMEEIVGIMRRRRIKSFWFGNILFLGLIFELAARIFVFLEMI